MVYAKHKAEASELDLMGFLKMSHSHKGLSVVSRLPTLLGNKMCRLCPSLGEHMDSGGAPGETGFSGPSDGAGDRGDPPALPGQEAAHHGRH